MSEDQLNTLIVFLLLIAVALVSKADRMNLLSTSLFRLRIHLSKPVPVGWYRFEQGVKVRVGRPDTILVLKMPVLVPGEVSPVQYTGVTDSATRFIVGGALATLDGFLEGYDDELGAIEVQVNEAGKLAEVGIGNRDVSRAGNAH